MPTHVHALASLIFIFFSLQAVSQEKFAKGNCQSNGYLEFVIYYPDQKKALSDKKLAEKFKGKTKGYQFLKEPDFSKKNAKFVPLDDVKTEYPPINKSALMYYAKGVDKELAEALYGAKKGTLLMFSVPSKDVTQANIEIAEFIHQVSTETGGLIWDQSGRTLFSPDAWKKGRLTKSENGFLDISDHIRISSYKDDDFIRAVTLGMEKFGLPDIEVSDFVRSSNRSVGNTINLLAQQLYENPVLSSEGKYTLSPKSLKHTSTRKEILQTLFENAKDKVEVDVVVGINDEGDPQNTLMEITIHDKKGAEKRQALYQLISSLWGWEGNIVQVEHNKKILAASAKAKKEIPKLRKKFLAGLAPGEFIQLKAPFPTPTGGNEWMWVEISNWDDDEKIVGMLKNQPFNIPDLNAGEEVKINSADIFDYLHKKPDGSSVGNETAKLIEAAQK